MLNPTRTELVAERCRRSLRYFAEAAWPLVEPGVPFVGNWHLDVICEHLEAVSRREVRRLIINIPPRCMKSLSCAVFWPCWEWLARPETRWLFASYAAPLSERDSLKCRRLLATGGVAHRDLSVVEQAGYQGLLRALWGDDAWEITRDQDAKRKFDNTRMGYRLATSVGGQGTGEGGDIIVIDDPHKADEAESETVRLGVLDWHDSTIPTRFNQPKRGAEVVIMQRLHEKDLSGHLLERGGWTHLCLPMEFEPAHPFVWPRDPRVGEGDLMWPDRVGPDELAGLKRDLGGYRSAGQLQQRPAPAEGFMFKRRDFRYWRSEQDHVGAGSRWWFVLSDELGGERRFDSGADVVRFQTVDAALSERETSDFTVVATWAVTTMLDLVLLDLHRRHFEEQQVVEFLAGANDKHGRPPMWIERFGAGRNPLAILAARGHPVMEIPPEAGAQQNKLVRAFGAVALAEQHKLFFPAAADWLPVFEEELASFPNGRNDDMVDVTAYAARLRPIVTVPGSRQAGRPDRGPRPHSAGIRSRQF